MKVTHVYAGGDGRSHFLDRELRMAGDRTAAWPVERVEFRQTGAGPARIPHRTAPRRQLVLLLQGRVAYECGGERRDFGPGDVILFDDTSGEGHAADVLETPRLQAIIPVPADLDLDEVTVNPKEPS